jgi:hypothetical protein
MGVFPSLTHKRHSVAATLATLDITIAMPGNIFGH